MSSQRGNVKKSGPAKHQNKMAFKNTLYDKSKKTVSLNKLQVAGCCSRCKDVIDWKIKYKKYKLLSQPKKCTNCQQKTVTQTYFILCGECIEREHICGKCGKKEDFVLQPKPTASEEASQQSQLAQDVKLLKERERRTFFRLNASGKLSEAAAFVAEQANDALSDAEQPSSGCSDEENLDNQDELGHCVENSTVLRSQHNENDEMRGAPDGTDDENSTVLRSQHTENDEMRGAPGGTDDENSTVLRSQHTENDEMHGAHGGTDLGGQQGDDDVADRFRTLGNDVIE